VLPVPAYIGGYRKAIDRPGHLHAPSPGEGFRVRDEADDIAEERPLPAEHAPEPRVLDERDAAAHQRGRR
jgi:hypothetical protein